MQQFHLYVYEIERKRQIIHLSLLSQKLYVIVHYLMWRIGFTTLHLTTLRLSQNHRDILQITTCKDRQSSTVAIDKNIFKSCVERSLAAVMT